jgi:Lon protease-like protein
MHVGPIEFDRVIPVFPLPNCVLFPGVVQPLHIFEPRYRAMMREVLEGYESSGGQKAMALGLLKPGWEKDYYSCPSFYPRVCVGRVIAHELLPDGKYNLLLQGMARAQVVSQEKRDGDWGIYRVATLEPVAEVASTAAHEKLQRRVLQQLFGRTALKDLTVTPALSALFEDSVPTSRLIDGLAFSLVQDVAAKQRLLETEAVGARGEMLLQELVALAGRLGPVAEGAKERAWPPEMGVN